LRTLMWLSLTMSSGQQACVSGIILFLSSTCYLLCMMNDAVSFFFSLSLSY
jgi:hypothetical protein